MNYVQFLLAVWGCFFSIAELVAQQGMVNEGLVAQVATNTTSPLPLSVFTHLPIGTFTSTPPVAATTFFYKYSSGFYLLADSLDIQSDWFIDGEVDAAVKHKATSSLIVGLLSGCATAPYIYTGTKGKPGYILGATLFSLPVIGNLASTGIRVKEEDFDAEWEGNAYYLAGYRKGAKKKNKRKTLLGYGIGFATGLGLSFLVDSLVE